MLLNRVECNIMHVQWKTAYCCRYITLWVVDCAFTAAVNLYLVCKDSGTLELLRSDTSAGTYNQTKSKTHDVGWFWGIWVYEHYHNRVKTADEKYASYVCKCLPEVVVYFQTCAKTCWVYRFYTLWTTSGSQKVLTLGTGFCYDFKKLCRAHVLFWMTVTSLIAFVDFSSFSNTAAWWWWLGCGYRAGHGMGRW